MPIELTRKSERFAFSNHQWEELLILAKDYGWIPQDAPDVDWERIYFASNGDTISERDALALAEALTRALQKQPEPIRTPLHRLS
jgi:deoxyinosine 3'endonuclease (endonuclease V)